MKIHQEPKRVDSCQELSEATLWAAGIISANKIYRLRTLLNFDSTARERRFSVKLVCNKYSKYSDIFESKNS